MRVIRTVVAATTPLILTGALTACSAQDGGSPVNAAGEIEITCATCQESTTDPFLQFNYEAAQRFNEAHRGRYRVVTLRHANAGSGEARLPYYQRLAMANDLPDVFQLNSAEIESLSSTGRLHDFAPELAADAEWSASFQPRAFDGLSGPEGQRWAIPQQQDPVGIFYNRELLAHAGHDAFPTTWDEFESMAADVRATGTTPIALDGDWATILMWSNLIGTHPEGAAFLADEIATSDDWSANAAVVAATERLRSWHTEGYVNADAFSGDFQNAASKYLAGTAVAIPNGPWFVKTNLRTSQAAPGLYEDTEYVPSPGWGASEQGLIVVSGAGWVSGTADPTRLEAVEAFVRFMSSTDEVVEQARSTGSNPPVTVPAATLAAAELEPLSSGLVGRLPEVALTYPHARVHAPGGIDAAWKNLWPAYVNGEIDTAAFLSRLAADSAVGG
ncbi:ABC transporter substrate-binding protein [Streptomyces sp. DSM 44915]|uniref:ABC transporter substrate-binding protein n=1 Tax=Streptomyces chisholmiae TaxID=3075540 RepID=A0ABU2JPB3_9ACTN|nr:ABC transporter substrate-binding protein [Streptomyces sp. DSM 44915]MDT0266048.1 ABC transporter substrate-binding protein [Streptomyces sp. DSM 44915]